MTGEAWAVVAGLGFGVFQTINRRAVSEMNVFVATFLQLLVSALVLIGAAAATEDISALFAAPFTALIRFALAGVIHFSIGWTFLNGSQKRIGASRTRALIGTTPLFGAILALVTLGEGLNVLGLIGIALTVAGAYFTTIRWARDVSRPVHRPRRVASGHWYWRWARRFAGRSVPSWCAMACRDWPRRF